MKKRLGKWSAGALAVLVIFGSTLEVVQAEPLRTVSQWQQRAEKLRGERQLRAYDEAIDQYPAYVDFYLRRGKVHLQRGESQLAKLDFDKAILLDDKNAAAYTGRAEERACAGDSQGAWLAYEQAIKLDDKNPLIFQSRAHFYYEGLADYRQAFADYDQAAKLVTAEDDPRRLKIALQKLGAQLKYATFQNGYYGTVVNSVDSILGMKKQKLSPRQLEYLYISRCVANYELEQYSEALRDSQQVLRLMDSDPSKHARILQRQSRILTKMGLEPAAKAAMKAALRCNPKLLVDRQYELDKDLVGWQQEVW
ncbi:Tetratricopeptide repeat-containing protein [Selenomonas sp. WCT3]|uniref:tetratricopeptide repeat protein n=1 Tax=Selenomonas sp. WCT3 TaxID=3158785 RepID=UPI00088FAD71|nr:Tetratricopeptide repeat-containing protein [Selenomonas ruminantium]